MSKIITDPDLGKLVFTDIEGTFSYDCKITLSISRKQVKIFFETNHIDNHPTAAQKQFLQNIIDNYKNILEAIASETSHKRQELEEEYDLYTIGIPINIEIKSKWDLSLLSRKDKSMSILANFEGMKPIKIWNENVPKRPFLLKLLLKIAGL